MQMLIASGAAENRILPSEINLNSSLLTRSAIHERVINKRSLNLKILFVAKVGEKVDRELCRSCFRAMTLSETDFGSMSPQFAIRGGILRCFSFSQMSSLPIRAFW